MLFYSPAIKDKEISKYGRTISLFVGLIFATHPIQTEAVTYVVQRATSLATLFYLASLCLYVKSRLCHIEKKKNVLNIFYALSLVAALAAMFSKEMAITLPFSILLCEATFFKKDEKIMWRILAPFFVVALIIPITLLTTGSINVSELRRIGETGVLPSPINYLLTQFNVIVTYIRLVFLPLNQNLDYDYRLARNLLEPMTLLHFVVIILSLIYTAKLFAKNKLVSFGILWFFLTLLPESSILPIRDVIFEHRLYLPMLGYALFLVCAIYYLVRNKQKRLFVITLASLVAVYSLFTYKRNVVWADPIALWSDVIDKSPHKARPYNCRGVTLAKIGKLDRAINDFSIAIRLNPSYEEAYNNRGVAYANKGDFNEAIADFSKAIFYYRDYVDAYNNRGLTYANKREYEAAIADYNNAIQINPNCADFYNNRAVSYFRKKEFNKSWEDIKTVFKLKGGVNPDFLEAIKSEMAKTRPPN